MAVAPLVMETKETTLNLPPYLPLVVEVAQAATPQAQLLRMVDQVLVLVVDFRKLAVMATQTRVMMVVTQHQKHIVMTMQGAAEAGQVLQARTVLEQPQAMAVLVIQRAQQFSIGNLGVAP